MGNLFNRTFSFSVDSFLLDGFDINFSVERSVSKSPNTAKFVVFNLPKEIRDQITKKKDPLCQLSVGYDGSLTEIFVGSARDIVHSRSGGDISTEISCGDSEAVLKKGWISKSFSAGARLSEVAFALFDSLNLKDVSSAKAYALSYFGFKIANAGMVLSGNPSRELAQFCRAQGLQYSIQNGKLFISKIGDPYLQVATVLDSTSGLVDPPPTLSPKGELTCNCLLNPALTPGSLVQIVSEFVTGLFLVEKVVYQGDFAGGSWYCALEGKLQK